MFCKATFYLAELFRQTTFYLVELFCQATFYLAELCRQIPFLKYLGDCMREKWPADSAYMTVTKRSGLVRKYTYDVKSVIVKCIHQMLQGLGSGLQNWLLGSSKYLQRCLKIPEGWVEHLPLPINKANKGNLLWLLHCRLSTRKLEFNLNRFSENEQNVFDLWMTIFLILQKVETLIY